MKSDTDMTHDADTQKALNVFRELKDTCPVTDLSEFEIWMLHAAHDMMRSNQITKVQFAIIMDEVCCW